MQRSSMFSLALVIGSAWLWSGCSQGQGARCQVNKDCSSGLVCCVNKSAEDLLIGGVCTPPEECELVADAGVGDASSATDAQATDATSSSVDSAAADAGSANDATPATDATSSGQDAAQDAALLQDAGTVSDGSDASSDSSG